MAENELRLRRPTLADVPVLTGMNRRLIQDEGHRNRMTEGELADRMRGWLEGSKYEAVLFSDASDDVGYALFRCEPEHVYLRQFFIVPDKRRRGLGRRAMDLLRQQVWAGRSRVRVEVLVNNARGMAFWRAVGFMDYCVTLELQSPEAT